MQFKFGKNILTIFVLFAFCFANTTCKKGNTNNLLVGTWVAFGDCSMKITIGKDNRGGLSSREPLKGCGATFDGKVRYTNSGMFFGITHFKFIEKPNWYYGNDSVAVSEYGKYNKYALLATMKLQNSPLHGSSTRKYYKITNY